MSLKIDTNQSVTAYHVVDGAVTFSYKTDANNAVSRHPLEWSHEPWTSRSDIDRGVKHIRERHAREMEQARARKQARDLERDGAPAPLNLPDHDDLTAEERSAQEEYERTVEEAKERLRAFQEKKAAEKAEAEQAAADEALIKTPPPVTGRRPFGRTGEPTPAEIEMMRKRQERQDADDAAAREQAEADERLRLEKDEADRIGAAEASGAKIT